MANARKTAQNALLRVNIDGGYSNLVWDAALTAAGLDARDAAFAGALFYGVLERRLTLDHVIAHYSNTPLAKLEPAVLEALRLGVYQLLYMDRVPDSAAVDQSVRLVKQSRYNRYAGFVNGILRSVQRGGNELPGLAELPELQRLSVVYSVPEWLVRHYINGYGRENALGLMASFLGRRPLYLRVNTCKTTPAGLVARLAEEGRQAAVCEAFADTVTLSAGGDLTQSKAYGEGLFHVQDASSGLCCQALDPKPGQRVLDVCAAPGGKAFTLAQRMADEGELVACDLYPQKAELIRTGAARLGLTCVRPVVGDAAAAHPEWGRFDAILCDLPCSGLGILGRKPEIRYKNVTFLDNLPDLQYGILCKSLDYLKPGGRLVFSTCTLNPAENEQNAARLLAEHKELSPLPILPERERVCGEPPHFINLLPHVHGTDGFFIAAVVKR